MHIARTTRPSGISLLVAALLACATAMARQPAGPSAPAPAGSVAPQTAQSPAPPITADDLNKGMQQADDEDAMIDAFAGLAAKADVDGMLAMIDPKQRSPNGDKVLRDHISKVVLPFFADFQSVDTYEGVDSARLPDGRTGMMHFGYIVTREGKMRPFTVALIRSGTTLYVATIIVDRCIKGQHPVTPGRCDVQSAPPAG